MIGMGTEQMSHVTRLPFVVNAVSWGMTAQLFDVMRSNPLQRRLHCVWDSRLAYAAQAHAEDMVRRGYFSHTTPEGICSNGRVRAQGYKLPNGYPDSKNFVESIGGGYETVEAVWQGWLDSPDHRRHVLGETDFYAGQTNVGIGYAAQTNAPLFDAAWVLLSAPDEGHLLDSKLDT